MLKPYNGHRSWNAWNVSLWISNDEILYNLAMDLKNKYPNRPGLAAKFFIYAIGVGSKTPDGAKYNHLSVKLAIEGL